MTTPDIEQFAKEWRYENTNSYRVWLNRSLIFNGALLLLLMLMAVTLLTLLPLKEKVPYLFSHNQTTGEIIQLGQLNHADFSEDWALIRHFIVKYITNREEYHSDNVERPFQLTYALSSSEISHQYYQKMQSDNPLSPLNLYKKDKFVTVNIKSIAKLNDNTVEVHFDKVIHDKGINAQRAIPMVTIMKWQFVDEPVTQTMLDRNPLGFKVTHYNASPVTLDK